MKKICALLGALAVFALQAVAATTTVVSRAVVVDTNGVILIPTNLATANGLATTTQLSAQGANLTNAIAGATNGIAGGIPTNFISGGVTQLFGSAAASAAGDFLSSNSNGLQSITISEAPVGTYSNRVQLAGTPSGSHLGIYQHVTYSWPPQTNGWLSEALLYTIYSNGNTQRVGGIGVRNGFGAFMYCSTNEPYFQFFDDNHQLRSIVVAGIRLARTPTNDGPLFAATTGQMWMNTNSMICVLTNPTTQVSLAYVPSNTTLEATVATLSNAYATAAGSAANLLSGAGLTNSVIVGALNAGGVSITNAGGFKFSDGSMIRSNGNFFAPTTTTMTNNSGALFTGNLVYTNETFGWRQASVPFGYTLNGVLSSGPELNCPVNSSSTFLLFETGTPFPNKVVYVRGLLHFDPSESSTGIVSFSCAMRSYTNATVSAAAITPSWTYNITNNGTMIQPFAFALTNWTTAINGTAYIQIQPSGTLFRAYRCVIVGAPEFRKE